MKLTCSVKATFEDESPEYEEGELKKLLAEDIKNALTEELAFQDVEVTWNETT